MNNSTSLTIKKLFIDATLFALHKDQRSLRLKKYDFQESKLPNELFESISKMDLDEFVKEWRNVVTIEQVQKIYKDSRIHWADDLDKEINYIVGGIDINATDINYIHTLEKEEGREVDLMLAHHPTGGSLMSLTEVMPQQIQHYLDQGLSMNSVTKIFKTHCGKIDNSIIGMNYSREKIMSKGLKIPLINLHTQADNHVDEYYRRMLFNDSTKSVGHCVIKDGLATVEDVRLEVCNIPENKYAIDEFGYHPKITSGCPDSLMDKTFVAMTGGTNPDSALLEKSLVKSGVSTVVGMHCGNDFLKIASKEPLTYLNTVHMPSDSLGMNLMFDNVLRLNDADVEVLGISGWHRIKRI